MENKIFFRAWPFLVITIIIFAFFYKLFIPKPSIFITPDYGRSDSWHFSIANKFYLAQELKKNRLPIWNPHIGTGYPALAEGQSGIFFLPNLVFFRLLPFIYAYNLTLVGAFITAGFGTYFFCRSLKLSKPASLFAGTVFPLGGFFVFHVQHHNLLQTASLMPWLFWAVNEFVKTKKILFLLLLSLILSQQFMAGFPQITFYSLIAMSLYLGLKHLLETPKSLKVYIAVVFAIILGTLIAAVQILPSYEFFRISSKSSDPKQILEQFPYVAKNLLQFLDPFILGSPKNGSYPHWTPGKWGIFWESQGYIGILPLVLAAGIIIAVSIRNLKIRPKIYIFAFLFVFTIMLSLGKESPTNAIYSIPPFSFFRVPSRFLLISQFSLSILAAYFVNKFKNHLVAVAIITLSIVNLYTRTAGYNPIGKASDMLREPETAAFLKTQDSANVMAIGNSSDWNEKMMRYGWENTLDYFSQARNYLDQNSNLIYGVSSAFAYESMLTKRYSTKNSILLSGESLKNNTIFLSSPAKKIINSDNISHIVTTKELSDPDFKKIFETTTKYATFKIFENKKKAQKYFITGNYSVAANIPQIVETINRDNFDPQKEAVLEKDPGQIFSEISNYQISESKVTPTYKKLGVNSSSSALLVSNESFYPGWIAKIDGKKTQIFPANINSRAIVIPAGNHIVEFSYRSKTITYAAVISTFTLLLTLFAVLKIGNKKVAN